MQRVGRRLESRGRVSMSGNPCCADCVGGGECDGCEPIAANELPGLAIPGWKSDLGWVAIGPCCWVMDFVVNGPDLPIEFIDGGALQIDSWELRRQNELRAIRIDRGPISVGPNQWLHSISGVGDVLIDIGQLGLDTPVWQSLQPAPPECIPTGPCLTEESLESVETMQRWGLWYQKTQIRVSVQRAKVKCGTGVEGCKIIWSSTTGFRVQAKFGIFQKSVNEKTYQAGGCCATLPDTTNNVDYPNFNDPLIYGPPSFEPQKFVRTTSTIAMDAMPARNTQLDFGSGICADCSPETSFCLGACGAYCLTASGSGAVPMGPFGVPVCVPVVIDVRACSIQQAYQVVDYAWWEYWADPSNQNPGDPTLILCQAFPLPEPLPTCPADWTVYAAVAAVCSSSPNHNGVQFLSTEQFQQVVLPCTPVPVDCPDSSTQPRILQYVGSMLSFEYSTNCSGPITQTFCPQDRNWAVEIK